MRTKLDPFPHAGTSQPAPPRSAARQALDGVVAWTREHSLQSLLFVVMTALSAAAFFLLPWLFLP